MPVSASQHRASAGAYQNKLHNDFRSKPTQVWAINPDRSGVQDERLRFGRYINRIVNSHEELGRPSYQTRNPRQGIAVPLLMLLSQIRLDGIPRSATTDKPAQFHDRGLYATVSRNTAQTDNSGNGFSSMLSPAMNALYETGQFISRHDPLRFPAADAAPLCSGAHLPDDFVTFLNSKEINVVSRGLDNLKYIEHNKYEFFKGVSINSINLLDSAIKQLEDKKNDELGSHLRYYGIVDVYDVRPRLLFLYKKIKSEIYDNLNSKRDSVYYGYGSMAETANVDAMVILNDKDRRILLTDNFFAKCTVNAINVLIHEMSHFHTKFDLFQVIKQNSCLEKANTDEIPVHEQLDDLTDFYIYSIRHLKEDNIVTDGHIQLVYNMNKKEFVDAFNTDKTVKEEAIFINADTISNLAIAIGNYGFKRDNVMPLLDTSEFKTGEPIES